MALVFIPELLHHLPGRWANLEYVLFGFGAINYAKHPEGVVEFGKRRSIERVVAWNKRREERRQPRQDGPPPPPADDHEREEVSA
jgi:hypothetical protein